MKKNYSKATVEVIEFRAEKGFAASSHTASTEGYTIDNNDPFSGSTGSGSGDEGGFSGWDF